MQQQVCIVSVICALHELTGFCLKKYFSTFNPITCTWQPCKKLVEYNVCYRKKLLFIF